jgi:2-polyprenyl-3-methyl-5-hydroxy-6-metoxy-1,4-benzoquinol methylase
MDSFLEYRNCPSCGRDDFSVLFGSNMQPHGFNVLYDYKMEEYATEESGEGYLVPGDQWGRHVKCKNCGLVYMNPIERVDRTNGYYSRATNNHAPTIRESYLRTAQAQVRLVQERAKGTNLLDIGCAQGFFLFCASRAGYTVRGVELSQDAADYARTEFGLDIEVKPFEAIEFPDNAFDVVTLWQTLEHLTLPLQTLLEVRRILKPGGLVVVSTPDIDALPSRVLGKRWWDIKRLHINQFSTRTLGDILQNAGFRDVSAASYRGFVSLSILVTMFLKYLDIYEQSKFLLNSHSPLGKIMNKMMLMYPSSINHCVVLGSK